MPPQPYGKPHARLHPSQRKASARREMLAWGRFHIVEEKRVDCYSGEMHDPYSDPLGGQRPDDHQSKFRIAVIGNSHLAAFKAGWPQIETDYHECVLTFFGATRSLLRKLAVGGGALRTRDDKLRSYLEWTSGKDHIPFDYDAYIIVGGELSFPHMAHILAKHRPPHCYDEKSGLQLISDAAFEASMRCIYDASSAVWLVKRLQEATKVPVVVAPCPFVTTNDLAKNSYWTESRAIDRVFGFYNRLLSELREHVVVDEQPNSTIVDRMFTEPKFAAGSAKIKPGFEGTRNVDDNHHMNALFGATWIAQILNIHLRDGFQPR